MAGLTLSRPMKVTLPCLLLGVIFMVTSFSVTYWLTADSENGLQIDAGLWKACVSTSEGTFCRAWSSDSLKNLQKDWMHKNQALQCLALILMVGAVVALLVFLFTSLKAAIVTSFITCFMSAIFMVVGSALFATDMNNDSAYSKFAKLGWAFGFNIVAAVFVTAAGVGMVIHMLFSTTSARNT